MNKILAPNIKRMTSKSELAAIGSSHPSAPNASEFNDPLPPSYDHVIGINSIHPQSFHSPPPTTHYPPQQPVYQPHPVAGGYLSQPGYQPVPLQQLPYPNPNQINSNQPMQTVQNTIIVQTPVGPHSTRTRCPHCQATIMTRVSHDCNIRTHLFALLCCIFCCPCTCLPYCLNSCKDTNHYCPKCNAFLGVYKDRI